MSLHHLLALEMALFLAGNFAGERPAVLGVVVQAHRAHVNTSAVSDGATIYNGDRAQEIEVELIKGNLAFSAECPTAVEIVAREARIRPVAEVRTLAQVNVIGPKELHIYARRGALRFLYRGESEMIAEGESYRVILDPAEDAPKTKKAAKPARQRKAFLFVVIGGGAAGAGVIAYEKHHHHKPPESPDRP